MAGQANENVKAIASTLQKRTPRLMGHQQLREAAVLVPLIEQDGEIHVLFEVRAQSLRRQPGEICFPGGRLEQQDGSASETAIRETCEELGLRKEQIELVGELDVLVGHSQLIYSFVGQIEQT
ncbi:MAG: NUDIX hydrolase, partial [Tumebacillaceae bacterium]